MKEIKIIDLLNMIAEGKKVPKKIKWGEHYLEWFVYEYKALKELGQPTLSELVGYGARGINDTVEIIEEDNNKIEKLKYHNSIPDKEDIKDLKMFIREILQNENILLDKINEVIDKTNKENNI